MSQADNATPETGNGAPTAGAQELTIPKYRLDEMAARLRAREEELVIKDRLLQQVTAQQQPARKPALTAEDLGMDPQTFQQTQKIAETIAHGYISQETERFKGWAANVSNELEATKFLLNHGKDKSSYLPRVKEYQATHYQKTGTYLDTETAYKMVRFDEMESRGQAAPTRQAQPGVQEAAPSQTPAPDNATNYPSPAMTRVAQPAGAGATQVAESIEDFEARLDEGFKQFGAI